MKLTQKLTLAFLLVSLIAIGLAAAFVWFTTSTQFSKYMLDQRQVEFVNVVTDYYKTNGRWAGVDTALREQGLLPPVPQPGAPAPDPQPFALVGPDRTVIIPGGNYQVGQKVQRAIIERGVSIEINGVVGGTVLITGEKPAPNAIEQKYIDSVNRSLLVAGLGGAVIALVLGLFIARSLTHPVRNLTAATRALASGKLEQQVPVRSKDELGELAASFNQMSVDLARATQSRKQMTADIAHDLRNPLTVIGGYIESIRDGVLKPTPERLESIHAEIQHLQKLVEELRTLSLADTGELNIQRSPFAPRDLLERMAAVYGHQAEQQKVNLIVDVSDDLPEINADQARMEQVMRNLVSNALRYMSEGGEIHLSAKQVHGGALSGQSKGQVVLAVQDTGTGILPDVLPHIFERSYRADPSRSGNESGLGLAIAKAIVELHGGRITAESAGVGRGSIFSVFIPLDS